MKALSLTGDDEKFIPVDKTIKLAREIRVSGLEQDVLLDCIVSLVETQIS